MGISLHLRRSDSAAGLDNSGCILLWGFNPHASWPAAAARISRAKAAGAKLIVIDPRNSAVAEKSDLWLRVRPGADGALAMSMIHVLLEEKLYAENFVRDWTNGGFLLREDNPSTTHGTRPLTVRRLGNFLRLGRAKQ